MFHEGTRCNVTDIIYDFDGKQGQLYVEEGNCSDMDGAINLFLAIDPDVISIYVFVPGKPRKIESIYEKRETEWFRVPDE